MWMEKPLLQNHIWRLRTKIELTPEVPQYILTYHSVGYRFRERNQSLEHNLCGIQADIASFIAVLIGAGLIGSIITWLLLRKRRKQDIPKDVMEKKLYI